MPKIRIDKLIVEKGLIKSLEKARALVMSGSVLVNEVPVTKAGQLVAEDVTIRITGADHPFVGRGGVKLQHALKEFNIDVCGKICADVGASTGGFTDCLLQNGAAKVYAIDVGYGQLDWKLRNDPRVVVMERTNIREVGELRVNGCAGCPTPNSELITHKPANPQLANLAVIDVSFISLEKVFPHVDKLLAQKSAVIALIKPQFEVSKSDVGEGGIVTNDVVRDRAVLRICRAAVKAGWVQKGLTRSPITGADGNVEFLAWFMKG